MTDADLVAAFDRLRVALGTAGALRVVARDLENVGTGIRPEAHELIVAVAERFNLTAAQVRGKKRSRLLDRARTICWWLMYRRLEIGPVEISDIFTGRNHSVITHALDSFRDRLVTDDVLRATVASFDRPSQRVERRAV